MTDIQCSQIIKILKKKMINSERIDKCGLVASQQKDDRIYGRAAADVPVLLWAFPEIKQPDIYTDAGIDRERGPAYWHKHILTTKQCKTE